jgi:hypothetical protein
VVIDCFFYEKLLVAIGITMNDAMLNAEQVASLIDMLLSVNGCGSDGDEC